MKGQKILLVGCGDIGIPLGLTLIESGASVWGLRRTLSVLPSQIISLQGDVTQPESLACLENIDFDYVVVTLTPISFTDEGYRFSYVQGLSNVLARLVQHQFQGHLFFISSTSVYHQSNGQWVDEQSPTIPVNFSGRRLLEAETLLDKCPFSSTVVRFAGIYGPGRRRLIDQVLALKGCPELPPLYTNRIHRDDCVGFLAHLILSHFEGKILEKLYIGVDNNPVTLWSVKRWLAAQLGVDFDTMDHAYKVPRASKRCSNHTLLNSGYELLYPDYQTGYAELIKNES